MEALTERHVTIPTDDGGVDFDIRRVLAPEGFELFEIARPSLVPVIEAVQGKDDIATAILSALSAFPPKTVEVLKRRLFKRVFFKSAAVPEWRVLASNEAMAFKDLTPVHIYEVFARSCVANFTECWDALESRTGVGKDTLRLLLLGTFLPSSPSPSPPDDSNDTS